MQFTHLASTNNHPRQPPKLHDVRRENNPPLETCHELRLRIEQPQPVGIDDDANIEVTGEEECLARTRLHELGAAEPWTDNEDVQALHYALELVLDFREGEGGLEDAVHD